ncbi:helix-turn-helix transcriptional regulator [bacterium]|nr:helix-turn-helix transcriptional regulator [bacterium]
MHQHTTAPDSPLRTLRKQSGLSACDFARTVGVDVAILYATETGTREPGRTYQRALRDMGVDVAHLLDQHRRWRDDQAALLRTQHSARIRSAAEGATPAGDTTDEPEGAQ